MPTIDLKRFHAAFFAESFDGLGSMEDNLLQLEQGERDPEVMNAIFRVVHSMKGAGGSLGFGQISEFSHQVETLLDRIRKGQYEPTQDTVDLLLSAVDCLRELLTAAQTEAPPDLELVHALQDRLAALSDQDVPVSPPLSPRSPLPSGERGKGRGAAPKSHFRICLKPNPAFFSTGNDPLRLFRLLAGMGELTVRADLARLPAAADFDPESCYLGWELELVTTSQEAEINEVFEWVRDDCELTVANLAPREESTPAAPQSAVPEPVYSRRREDYNPEEARPNRRRDDPKGPARTASLHVSTEKVDDLVNLVGELVISQTALKQIVENFDMGQLARLKTAVAQLERHTRGLQEGVMGIRMLPVSFAFGRFNRVVRDVSQQLNKQVQLMISGEQSELDKTVIEKLIDPLTHLVRNSLDHGIEPPAERRAKGKPEVGTLTLHAEHKGGNIIIEVRDDGCGIDYGRVRAKGIQAGLLHEHEEASQERLHQLIFMPGFSTAASVTDLSGRGVGLDVVRRNITDLGGSLEIASVPGQGSAFTIRLPLTLAILDGMYVAARGETYILPLLFIVECVTLRPDAIRSVSGKERVIEVRGEYVPIVELGALFPNDGVTPSQQPVLVLLEADGRKIALQVEALLGQDQVVIKSLEANYRRVKHVAGATILGDGRVAFILDVNSLVRSAGVGPTPAVQIRR